MKNSAERLFTMLTTEICANDKKRRLAALKAIGDAWFVPRNTWKDGSRGCVTLTAASGASGRAIADFPWLKPGNEVAGELCIAKETLNEATALWDSLSWISRLLLRRKIRSYAEALQETHEAFEAPRKLHPDPETFEGEFTP